MNQTFKATKIGDQHEESDNVGYDENNEAIIGDQAKKSLL